MIRSAIFSIMAALELGAFAGSGPATSIIFINEDWYGHQNSTINILRPDDPKAEYWTYRVIQEANPGKELGCTNQYGAIFGDRLYLIAKQDKDPGATVAGGRITVADAATFKIIKQLQLIDPSGAQCDGRAFCGVTESKGYVSSSNGIWILNLETLEIEGQVAGSANPNAGGDTDKPNTDPTGSLYLGQSGTMILAEGKVFAVHQQYGLLVIDPLTDEVTDLLGMDWVREAIAETTGELLSKLPGIGSTLVRSLDGMLWHSLSTDDQGLGTVLPYIVRIDPATLERTLIPIGEGEEDIFAPSNSWYAWTPDPWCASSLKNELYWCGGSNRWFSKQMIYRFDVESGTASVFADLREDPADWSVYGCSIGVDPRTDEVYASLFHDFQEPTYIVRRYSPEGENLMDYPMISHYWFPSLPLFTYTEGVESWQPEVSGDEAEYGILYNLQGIPCTAPVKAGDWGDVSPGVYIWKSPSDVKKILVK